MNCTSQNFQGGLRACAARLPTSMRRVFLFTVNKDYKTFLHVYAYIKKVFARRSSSFMERITGRAFQALSEFIIL